MRKGMGLLLKNGTPSKMVRRRVEEADTAYSARSTSPEEDAKAVENSESMEAFSYDKEEAKKAIMTSLLEMVLYESI